MGIAIKIDNFKGLLPRMDASLLPEGVATVANNLILKSGKIVPLKKPSNETVSAFLENSLSDISGAGTIHPWKRMVSGNYVMTMLAWPGDVSVAQSNLADDDRDRIFVAGDTGIHHSATAANEPGIYFNNRADGSVCRRSMIKDPLPKAQFDSTTLSQAATAEASGVVSLLRTSVFFQTWVDKYGYESPASEPSDLITYEDGMEITLNQVTKPSDAVARRIYKTVTGDKSFENRFVTEFTDSNAFGYVSFSVKDQDCGEPMPTIESPRSDMRGIVYVPGNFYAAYSEGMPHTVFFSDPAYPYSWPTEYQYDIHDRIVGLATSKNTVFAMTDNRVWILRGTHPSSMVQAALSPAACVSRRSIVEFNNNVFFASNYGYCVVHNTNTDGDVVTNMTETLLTKDQWRALNPSSCVSVQIDGRIMAFFSTPSGSKSLIFDMNEKDCILTTHDESANCACVYRTTDRMYFV